MKRKARIQMGIDDRLVAIYARKSRITNKGDSIGVQFKQSADYAINQLSLSEDYEFARYEDKGCLLYTSQALFFDERKESELAMELGISQPAVYKRKMKVLKKLKLLLEG